MTSFDATAGRAGAIAFILDGLPAALRVGDVSITAIADTRESLRHGADRQLARNGGESLGRGFAMTTSTTGAGMSHRPCVRAYPTRLRRSQWSRARNGKTSQVGSCGVTMLSSSVGVAAHAGGSPVASFLCEVALLRNL